MKASQHITNFYNFLFCLTLKSRDSEDFLKLITVNCCFPINSIYVEQSEVRPILFLNVFLFLKHTLSASGFPPFTRPGFTCLNNNLNYYESVNHSRGEPGLLRQKLYVHTCCKELTTTKDANNVTKNSMTCRRTRTSRLPILPLCPSVLQSSY